jgi:hypothetical protein
MPTSDSPRSIAASRTLQVVKAAGGNNSAQLLKYEGFDLNTAPAGVEVYTALPGTMSFQDGYVRGTYPANQDGNFNVISVPVPVQDNIRDLYIEVRGRMPLNRGGFKFLKIFGERAGSNYANTTLSCLYGVGDIQQISFGDGAGATIANDTANVINLNGTNKSWAGRSAAQATILTPQNRVFTAANWGTDWHVIKLRVKYNSGTSAETEVADGAYFLSIDDVVFVDATGLLNRHWSNGPIESVNLFDWAQGNTSEFTFDYDYVRLSVNGFM